MKAKIFRLSALLTGLLLLVTLLLFFTKGAWAEFHSDCTDSLLWGEASLRSGHLISHSFYYAAVNPFGGNLFFLPFLALFGATRLTQALGMFSFTLLFYAVTVLCLSEMLRSREYRISRAILYANLFFCLFFGSRKSREIFYQHILYYTLGLLFLFLIFYGLLRMMRIQKMLRPSRRRISPRTKLSLALPVFLGSFFAAANGTEILVLSLLPLLGGSFFLLLLPNRMKETENNWREQVLPLGSILLGVFLGHAAFVLASRGVVSGYASAFSKYSEMSTWGKNAGKLLPAFFQLLGVDPFLKDPIVSLTTVRVLPLILYTFLVLILPLVSLPYAWKRGNSVLLQFGLLHLTLSLFLLYGYFFGRLSAGNWRLIPMLATGALNLFLFLDDFTLPSLKRVRILFAILLLLPSLGSALLSSGASLRAQKSELMILADTLKNLGWTKGYATFWNSASVRILSDSKVDLAPVTVKEGEVSPYRYQSFASDYHAAEGPVFLILTDAERDDLMMYGGLLTEAKTEKTIAGYHVYLFSGNFLETK